MTKPAEHTRTIAFPVTLEKEVLDGRVYLYDANGAWIADVHSKRAKEMVLIINEAPLLEAVVEAAKDVSLLLDSYASIKGAVGARGEFSRFNKLDVSLHALAKHREENKQ